MNRIVIGRVCATCGAFFERSTCPAHVDAIQYLETRVITGPPSPRRNWVPPTRKRITWGDR